MDLNRKDWLLIQRYITGNATLDESRTIKQWMEKYPENRKLVQELKEIWNLSPSENFDVDVQHAWNQFRDRNRGTKSNIKTLKYAPRKFSQKPLYLLRVAAVILVAFLTGLFVQHQTNTLEQIATEQASSFNVLERLETKNGEMARVTFSDGTRVILNSASSVQFPKKFHGSTREVFLDGEAYFEVEHNPVNPFIVHSQDARVAVLGTEFNVRGWSEETSVEVFVRGGKVSVQSSILKLNERTEVILTEGLKTQINRGHNPSEPNRVDSVNDLLWTNGGIHFDNKPFHQVVRNLERRFNIEITVIDSDLLDVPYTGTFQYAELNEVLSVIAVSMNFEFQRDSMNVVIH